MRTSHPPPQQFQTIRPSTSKLLASTCPTNPDINMSRPPSPPPTSPNMAEKKTLVSFPLELIEAVAEGVHRDDLLSLRLVCRDVSAAVDRLFLSEFLTVRNCLLTAHSLEALVGITSTPRVCKKIKTLTLSMPWLNGLFMDRPFRGFRSGDAKSYNRQIKRRRIQSAWQAQKEMMSSRYHGGKLLDQALQNVASAKRDHDSVDLRLVDVGRWLDRVHGRSNLETCLGMESSPKPKESWDESLVEIDHAISMLLDAVGLSGIPLHGLHLPATLVADAKYTYPEWYTKQVSQVSKSFSTITSLSISPRTKDSTWLPERSLNRVRKHASDWFPALTGVSVPAHLAFRWLTETLEPNRFRKIEIKDNGEGTMRSGDGMIDLLRKHQGSLVHFRVVFLVGTEWM